MRIITFKIVITLFSLNLVSQVNAACLKNIFSVGAGADAIAYKASSSNKNFAKLSSTQASGVKVSWVVFCPEKKWEYNSYIRLRFLQFRGASDTTEFAGITEEETLPSIGLEGRKLLRNINHDFDIPFNFEIRDDLGMVIDQSTSLRFDRYFNLQMSFGMRTRIWQTEKREITAVIKEGTLLPMSGEEERHVGFLYGISNEYFQKMGRRASFKADLYFDSYTQEYGNLDINREEIGLRLNVVFRI